MDPSFTRGQAEQQVVAYLTETLARLPSQLFLSFDEPSSGRGRKNPGITVPCVDDNTVKDPPENYQVGYWVHGIPAGGFSDAIAMVRVALSSMRWKVETDDNGEIRAYSDNGYVIAGILNVNGGLTIRASTPCFTKANRASTRTEVTEIPHP